VAVNAGAGRFVVDSVQQIAVLAASAARPALLVDVMPNPQTSWRRRSWRAHA
jgi:hypothetical protein